MNCTNINNKRIFCPCSKENFLNYISDKKNILIAINAEKILNSDLRLKNIINQNIGYPDGFGAVLAVKRKGLETTRLPGVELWLDVIKANINSKKFYLIGSTAEVINKTVVKLQNEFPRIDILGYRNGFLNSGDLDRLKLQLIKLKPDIVLVAMGTPKQEYLMEELFDVYPALYIGLGGSFDVYCGLKKRAPVFLQKIGCEWLYRLVKEPTRIKRQFSLLKFFVKLVFDKL